jgi:hypothetical protein
LPDSAKIDAAYINQITKDAIQGSFSATRELTSRPAVAEVNMARQAYANPNLPPEAIKGIAAMKKGLNDYNMAMVNDWYKAKKEGNWKDINEYQSVWSQHNDPKAYIKKAYKDIGALKGEVDLPEGGIPFVGKDANGNSVQKVYMPETGKTLIWRDK